MIPEIDIDLTNPPKQRWKLEQEYAQWSNELLVKTVEEIGGVAALGKDLVSFAESSLNEEYREEIEVIAVQGGVSYTEALAANLYYDFIKYICGCTAFAVETEQGPVHARNMDWMSHENLLSQFTTINNFYDEDGLRFRMIGWPGSAGVLSAVAPGRFTLSLNAVLSDEPMQLATPTAFLLREVCQYASDYNQAVKMLCETPLASDCLVLITGTQNREKAVIERTPTQYAIRSTSEDYLVVTNDYRKLTTKNIEGEGQIYESTCNRFNASTRLLNAELPQNTEQCFAILNHPDVKMNITVQQMVMCARTGDLSVKTQKHASN